MTVKITNNGFSTLASGINNSATTIALASGEGARFPTLTTGNYFYGTLIDTSNNLEIVKVTARSTDSLTVVRAQDNTSARAFSTGDRFELRPVAKLFEDIQMEPEVDMWRLTTNQTADGNLTNLERCDDASFSKIGTGLSFDSSGGIFTFPRTGVYQVLVQATGRATSGDTVSIWTQVSTDNFSSNDITSQTTVGDDDSNNTAAFGQQFVNITNTSTHKVRFYGASIASGSYIQGDTDSNVTSFSFIRLGDSQ